MAFVIPVVRNADDAAHFDLQAQLDGVTYTLEFRWNVRLGAWFMNVLDAEGESPCLVGVRLVADWPLAQNIVDRSPPGYFLALDTGAAEGSGEDPGFDDLGSRVQLWYIPEAEI
jgi:hypothetical protein